MTMRRPLAALLSLLAAAAVVRGGAGCSSAAVGDAAADASSDAVGADVRVDRAPPPDEDATYPSPFDGWDLYPDYDPQCQFYVPKARENLPPPILWEPCRANPETATKSCRQMVFDWQPRPTLTEFITPSTRAFRRASGAVVLMTSRFRDDGTFRLVAEADGPVLVAVREQDPRRCVLGEERSDGEHYAYRVLDREAKGEVTSYGGGALGGRLDELRPTTLRHYHDTLTRGFIAGGPGLLEVSGGVMDLYSWKDGSLIKRVFSSDQDNGLAQNYQFFHGDTLFWASDTDAINKQKVYTELGGARDILSFGSDTSRGIADLGTDGQNLVWIEGTDRPQSFGVFPNVTAFVSPYTTDPAQIQKRALRSDLSGYPFGTSPFVVGCGYAARAVEMKRDGGFQSGTLLIRLSDGYAWHLPDGPGVDWGWRTPLAITCDEIFVRVAERPTPSATPRTTVARVRLDSLGAPTPP
jgi:hypothetical protein